jgi:TonB family protein
VARQRISIGPPDTQRAKELVLQRDDDLTKAAKGVTRTNPGPARAEPGPVQAAEAQEAQSATQPSRPLPDLAPTTRAVPAAGLALPRGLLQQAMARAAATGGQGVYGDASGSAQRMGPLQFDPQGADFTLWVQRFKDEVYRNWVMPQAAAFWGGEVSFDFTVERDGRMSALAQVGAGTGTTSLDRAAHNALEASRLLPLPHDYAPPTVTMRVTFEYRHEAPPQNARR